MFGTRMRDTEQPRSSAEIALQRHLVIAYLSYALDDVGALSPSAHYLLQMTVASLAEDTHTPKSRRTGKLSLRN